MSSVVVYGGSRSSQVSFINWVVGWPMIPMGNAGRCVVVWHLVGGVGTHVNVVVRYRNDLGLGVCPDDAKVEVKMDELDEFLGLVVDNDSLGFMVDSVHVSVPGGGRGGETITQLPEEDDLIEISRWLVDSSHIVVLAAKLSPRFREFEDRDKCPRRRVVVTPFVEGGVIMCVLGCARRWSQFTIRVGDGIAVSKEEDRWLRVNESEVRNLVESGANGVNEVEGV